jgi:hypothetical protein
MGSFGKPVSLQDEEYQFVPTTIPKRNGNRMRAMMIETYIAEIKDGKDRTDLTIKNLRAYSHEKHLEVKSIQRIEDEENKNDVLRCYCIMTEGTTYYKTIKQHHIDNYVGLPSDEEEIIF